MPKVYVVTVYNGISDLDKFAAYAKIAAPVIQNGGGRFLARGNAVAAYENGILDRTVIVEYDDLASARKVYEGPGYHMAIDALDNAANRDIRIVEALA